MRTLKSNDMGDHSNIHVRHNVYDNQRREYGDTGVGFQNVNNNVLKEYIEKWPSELKRKFYLLGGSCKITSENCDKVCRVLMCLERMQSFNSYSREINAVLNLVENMYIPECNNSYHSSGEEDNGDSFEANVSNEHVGEKRHSKYWFIGGIIITIVIGLFISLWFQYGEKVLGASESSKIEEWEKNIIDLREKFPSQNENMWFSIQSGVKATIVDKPVQPSVFLLLHNDKRTSTCIAQSVGKEAAKLLSDSPQEPIIIRGDELRMNKSLIQDYGLFTEIYKHDIEKKHVMIILDLQEIPAVLAQTFHVLCDVENPLVRDAAILFTMQIDGIDKQKPTAIAEKHLKLLWKDSLDIDIMDPLITRVTNMVLPLKLENDLSC